jgi:surface antigen
VTGRAEAPPGGTRRRAGRDGSTLTIEGARRGWARPEHRGGGRTAATVIGTLIGASIGGNVGRSMDQTDRLRTAQALETVSTGRSSSWRNPDTGAQYTVTPTRTRQTAEGPCREYTVDATVAGRPERVYGQACRQQDGSWRVAP